MTDASATCTRATSVSRLIKATRGAVWRACLDPDALVRWRVPDAMTGRIHAFEAREGGGYTMSLTYTDPARAGDGKTSGDTDTFEGRFVALVPEERIVEAVTFRSHDQRFAGEMRITTSLADAEGGTRVTVTCENLPEGIRPQDNEDGTRQSLRKLAALVE